MYAKLRSEKIIADWKTCTFGLEHSVRDHGPYWIVAEVHFNKRMENSKYINLGTGEMGEEKLILDHLKEAGFSVEKKRFLISWEYYDLVREIKKDSK